MQELDIAEQVAAGVVCGVGSKMFELQQMSFDGESVSVSVSIASPQCL